MVFLNPSILFGLLAATIPILIHILNFRKLQKVEFSTLTFLKELQKTKIKKIKIKQWLLLLLRTLIIIFLVLAFARPTLESTYFGGTTSTAKSSAVFIIDNSFSMSLVENNGSIFNKSKTEAKKIISQMRNEDEFYFVVGKDSVLHFTDKESAVKFLSEFDITLITEFLSNKILTAVDVLKKSKNINKEIYLFSDFRKNTFTDSTELKNTFTDFIKLYTFNLSESNADNTSVRNLKLENSIIEINKPVLFSAVVSNYSQNTSANITASLYLNNKRVAQQNVTLLPGKNKKTKFKTTLKDNGLIEAKVVLEEDNIIQDNSSYLSFYVPETVKVLIIYDSSNDIGFLKAALLSVTENKFKIKYVNFKNKSGIDYKRYDVIFSTSNNSEILSELKKVISSGSKVVIIPSSNSNRTDFNLFTSNLNYPEISEIITTGKTDYAQFDYVDFSHPLFQNLFTSNRKKKIDSPEIFKYGKTLPDNLVKPIIKLNDNSVFLGEYNLGKGKILFLNSALNLMWSNFPVKSIFAPLIIKTVFYLSSSNLIFNNYLTGQEIPIRTDNLTVPQIKVKLPEGTDIIGLSGFEGKSYKYKETEQAGNYKFYSNNKLIYYASVNVDNKESDLTKANKETINNFFKKYFGNNFINLDINKDYIKTIKQARYGTELWKPFLFIAFLLALIEMFVARNTKKDLMTLN